MSWFIKSLIYDNEIGFWQNIILLMHQFEELNLHQHLTSTAKSQRKHREELRIAKIFTGLNLKSGNVCAHSEIPSPYQVYSRLQWISINSSHITTSDKFALVSFNDGCGGFIKDRKGGDFHVGPTEAMVFLMVEVETLLVWKKSTNCGMLNHIVDSCWDLRGKLYWDNKTNVCET